METQEHVSTLAPALIAAYRATLYHVHAQPRFVLRIDQRSAELAALLAASQADGAVFITAWNPLGRTLDRAENEARHAAMLDALRTHGLHWIEGFGAYPGDPRQGEVSALVLGADRRRACALGEAHAQNAVVWAASDAVPRLLLLR